MCGFTCQVAMYKVQAAKMHHALSNVDSKLKFGRDAQGIVRGSPLPKDGQQASLVAEGHQQHQR